MNEYRLFEDILGRLVKAEVLEVTSGQSSQTFFRVPDERLALSHDDMDRKGYRLAGEP